MSFFYTADRVRRDLVNSKLFDLFSRVGNPYHFLLSIFEICRTSARITGVIHYIFNFKTLLEFLRISLRAEVHSFETV